MRLSIWLSTACAYDLWQLMESNLPNGNLNVNTIWYFLFFTRKLLELLEWWRLENSHEK